MTFDNPTSYIAGMTPVASESRGCFGLAWFATREEAVAYGAAVNKAGHSVNGGFLHGMPCDRAPEFDFIHEGRQLYASRH